MEHFWKTVEVIPEGIGFDHYGTLHLCWLAAFVLLTVLNCVLYRKLGQKGRKIWRIAVAALLVLDEVYKQIPLFVNGYFTLGYLPLHLCSINIFVIAFHALKPNKTVGNFLYTVCIPGAMAALLFFCPAAVDIACHAPHKPIESPVIPEIRQSLQHGEQYILGKILRVLRGGGAGHAPRMDCTGHGFDAVMFGHAGLQWLFEDVFR